LKKGERANEQHNRITNRYKPAVLVKNKEEKSDEKETAS
jgi:hypothetical protein